MEYLKSDDDDDAFNRQLQKLAVLEKAAEEIKNKFDFDESEPKPQVLSIQPSLPKAKGKPMRYKNLPDMNAVPEPQIEKPPSQPQISLKYKEDQKYFPHIEDDYDKEFYEPQYSCMEDSSVPFAVFQLSEASEKVIADDWNDYTKLYE
jgi:hypothetical protein